MRLKNLLKTFCRKKNIKNRVLKRMLKKFFAGEYWWGPGKRTFWQIWCKSLGENHHEGECVLNKKTFKKTLWWFFFGGGPKHISSKRRRIGDTTQQSLRRQVVQGRVLGRVEAESLSPCFELNYKITWIMLELSSDNLFATYLYTSYWRVSEFLMNSNRWLSYQRRDP